GERGLVARQGEGGGGGADTPPAGFEGGVVDRGVGRPDDVPQRRAGLGGLRPAPFGHHGVGRQPAGDLAGGVAAEAVGHHEDRAVLPGVVGDGGDVGGAEVLVVGP